jgi:hypothetical protein
MEFLSCKKALAQRRCNRILFCSCTGGRLLSLQFCFRFVLVIGFQAHAEASPRECGFVYDFLLVTPSGFPRTGRAVTRGNCGVYHLSSQEKSDEGAAEPVVVLEGKVSRQLPFFLQVSPAD